MADQTKSNTRTRSRTTQTGTGRNGRVGIVTKRQSDLREEAFYLHVEGFSIRAIARKMEIDPVTAAKYVRVETTLRHEQFEKERDMATFASVSFNQSIKRRALRRSEKCDEILDKVKDGTLDARVTDHSLGDAIKAQERIDKVLGIDAPKKLEIEGALQILADSLAEDDETERPLEA